MTRFARNIRKARENAGMTQAQFGRLIGVTWVTISRWERGVSKPRNVEKFGFNVPVEGQAGLRRLARRLERARRRDGRKGSA